MSDKMKWKGRLRLFLTLQCSASCPYCNNICPDKVDFSTIEEAGIEGYRKLFNRIETDQVIMAGGEPALHRDFNEIVDLSCKTYKDTIVYTNGRTYSIDKIEKLKHIDKLHICLSFHPTQISPVIFLAGYERLKALGMRFYWIAAVEDRRNMALLVETVDFLKRKGMGMLSIVPNWYYDPLAKCAAGQRYSVRCYMPDEPLVSPDLRVYICTSRMFAQDKKFSYDILKDKLPEVIICDQAGWCSMCDREHKKEEI